MPSARLPGRKLKALQVASGAIALIAILPSGAVVRLSSSSHLRVGSLVGSPFWPGIDVAHLPALTEPKFPVTSTSYDIDSRVKAILQELLSVYRVEAEKLEALRPDIIGTQDHCEVCGRRPAEADAPSVSQSGMISATPADWAKRSMRFVAACLSCSVSPIMPRSRHALTDVNIIVRV
jgi:hypothetical protein